MGSISGYFFMAGFFTSKFKSASNFLVASIFNLLSLFAYMIGYVLWYVATLFYPDYPRKHDEWYGFAEFKDQCQIAALIGIVASILCLLFPILILPTALLYAGSNASWCIAEYHKKENPPLDDEDYSSAKQALYFIYTALITSSSIVAVVAATVALLFPPIAFVVLTAATVIGIALSVIALYFWGQCTFGNFAPDKVSHSYNKLSDQLNFSLTPAPTSDLTNMPVHQKMVLYDRRPLSFVIHDVKNSDDLPEDVGYSKRQYH